MPGERTGGVLARAFALALLAFVIALNGLAPARAGVLDKLRGAAGEAQPAFLPVERAFHIAAQAVDANSIAVSLQPEPGYYLYRDKLRFSVAGAPDAIRRVDLPPGELKSDPNFGDTHVFHQPVSATLSLDPAAAAGRAVVLEVAYQGCADAGLCYPPEKKQFSVDFAGVRANAVGGPPPPATAGRPPAALSSEPSPVSQAGREASGSELPSRAPAIDESSRVAGLFSSGNFWLILASFFGFGLLLSLTPCVFPMIPILSGIIVGQGHDVGRRQAFGLSLVYVLGMAITYAVAGVAAGMSGTMLAGSLQQPWVLVTFAVLFVLLALSMFGFYELQLPSGLQTRLSSTSTHLKGGTAGGVFLMGVLSALIVGPCVAAPLAGALLYINKTRDAMLGGSALFAMAIGMGVPLLGVGLSAGALLPKAGAWMRTVKNFFGVVLIGLAIWTVSPVLPAVVHMLLWAALLIVSAIYLHAIDPLPGNASGFHKLWKGVGVISLLLGVALLIGALSGGRDLLQPLSGLRAGAAVGDEAHGLRFVKVNSVEELHRRLSEAGGRPVMLDFYADWCVSCKEMERLTFTDPAVRGRMERMLLLKADVTANTPDQQALLKRFELFGPPGTVFFDARGRQLSHRVIGFQPPEEFVDALDRALIPS